MAPRSTRPPPLLEPRVFSADEKLSKALKPLVDSLSDTVKLLQPYAQPEAWRQLPFYSDWRNTFAQPAQFRRGPTGEVTLRGWVSSTLGTEAVVGILPEGFRPARRDSWPGFRLVGGAYTLIRIDVDVDGRVLVAAPAMPAAAIDLSLSGITFSTTE